MTSPPFTCDVPFKFYERVGLLHYLFLAVVLVDKRCSTVLRGVSHEGRLIGKGARDQEPNGDTRRRESDLDRFGPSDRRNTLRLVSLVYCIDVYDLDGLSPEGTLVSPYILRRDKVTSKVSNLVLLQYLVQLVILMCTP